MSSNSYEMTGKFRLDGPVSYEVYKAIELYRESYRA